MYNKECHITFKSKLDQLNSLVATVRDMCSGIVHDDLILNQLELCLIEAVNNIIIHAYNLEPDHDIEVHINLNELQVVFKIVNSGVKNPIVDRKKLTFDPKDIQNLPESGMGLHILYELMDEVTFTEENGMNVTLLRKKISTPRYAKEEV